MKKHHLLLGAAIISGSLFFASCSDSSEEETKQPTPTPTPTTAPSTYTKKVALEEFTGAWCGWCVDGHYLVDQLMKNNPNKIVPIMVHQGDAMQINYYSSFYSPKFQVTGFPTGSVNRIPGSSGGLAVSRSLWTSMTNTELAKTATCGIAIDATAITGTTGKVKVRVGFGAEMTGGLNVSVYVLENKVTGTGSGYDQRNFIANRPGFENHPFYTQPATITGYMHNHVLRNVLSASFGDVIDVTKQVKGGIFEKEYDVNLAGLNPANVEIVALVHRAGNTSADMAVMNAQLVKVGENKAWD